MKLVVKKSDVGSASVYNIVTPSGTVVYRKRITPTVYGKLPYASRLEGIRSLSRIAGPSGAIRIGGMKQDSFKMRQDWSRVGQSVLDGVLAEQL